MNTLRAIKRKGTDGHQLFTAEQNEKPKPIYPQPIIDSP